MDFDTLGNDDNPFDSQPAPSSGLDFDDLSAPQGFTFVAPAQSASPFDDLDENNGKSYEPEPIAAPVETPLSLWEKQRKQQLMERRTRALDAKREQAQIAANEIDKFYQKRRERIQEIHGKNQEEEKNFRQELAHVMAHGTDWEKVAKFCDLMPKAKESRDVTRMRSLLIQLKNQKGAGKKSS
eukprot:TRINITY_DN1322_c0_g2_i1.p1 TRINITY_DN1322_c0_g2~~TRINITY_DN1322_c0_g2_i1.p1  ORF type:complete len:203 (-),score=90.77 TRINITY_DN1322_c0_g2_i1:257-805(-)